MSSLRGSLIGACALLAWDALVGGTYLFCLLVCPVWFLVSVVKNVLQRPGWKIALVRMAIPVVTLAIARINNDVQWRIAEAHARQIIAACDEFHAAHGKYPRKLDELVPQYLKAVPRAKYCLIQGDFMYWNFADDRPLMIWVKVPPYGRKTYSFRERRWGYVD